MKVCRLSPYAASRNLPPAKSQLGTLMFNVWRKAWAKDKESNPDDDPLIQPNAASEGDLSVLGIPETTERGGQAVSLVLDDVQDAACPEIISSSASGAALAHDAGFQHTNKSLHPQPTENSISNEDRSHDRDPPPPAKRRKVAPSPPSPVDLPAKDEARVKFEAAIGANSAIFTTDWLAMT